MRGRWRLSALGMVEIDNLKVFIGGGLGRMAEVGMAEVGMAEVGMDGRGWQRWGWTEGDGPEGGAGESPGCRGGFRVGSGFESRWIRVEVGSSRGDSEKGGRGGGEEGRMTRL